MSYRALSLRASLRECASSSDKMVFRMTSLTCSKCCVHKKKKLGLNKCAKKKSVKFFISFIEMILKLENRHFNILNELHMLQKAAECIVTENHLRLSMWNNDFTEMSWRQPVFRFTFLLRGFYVSSVKLWARFQPYSHCATFRPSQYHTFNGM